MNKRTSVAIYETDDFKRFRYPSWNREINSGNVNKIARSMTKFGYLGSPIVVNKFNEVVDGQHRLKACEKANVPVKYIICENYTSTEAMELNASQKSWTSLDYFKSFANQGNENYIKFIELVDQYKETIKVTFVALGLNHHGPANTLHRDGNMVLTDKMLEEAKYYLDYLSSARAYLVGDTSNVKIAIIKLLRHELIDGDQLLDQLERYNDTLKTTGLANIIDALEMIYNKNKKTKTYFTDKVKTLIDRGEW